MTRGTPPHSTSLQGPPSLINLAKLAPRVLALATWAVPTEASLTITTWQAQSLSP